MFLVGAILGQQNALKNYDYYNDSLIFFNDSYIYGDENSTLLEQKLFYFIVDVAEIGYDYGFKKPEINYISITKTLNLSLKAFGFLWLIKIFGPVFIILILIIIEVVKKIKNR